VPEQELEPVAPATRIELGRLLVVVVLAGVGAGVGGGALTLLLHLVQHLSYGYTEETFQVGVERASGARRVVMMTLGGLIVGLGWWWLRSRRKVKTVTGVLGTQDPRLPLPTTTIDAVLQVVAVGMGGSIGREGAPRQLGAAISVWIAHRAGLPVQQQRTLLACGAGAGLAAVYNVPLGGALFTLEVLLVSFAIRDVLAAVLTSAIATAVAWSVLSDKPTYIVEPFEMSAGLLVFAIVFGPLAGAGAGLFTRLMNLAQSHSPTGWRLPLLTTSVFAAVGVLSIAFPQLLGNGKGPAQLSFDGAFLVPMLVALVVLKPIVTAACLASGATGGTLTPSIATGALLGALTGELWSMMWTDAPTGAYALIGAAAFLASTHHAPLLAMVLVLELTHSGNALLVPIMIAVVTASVVSGRPPWARAVLRKPEPKEIIKD